MSLPTISIIVPSYNQGAFLERCIRGVLLQDYPAKQLIVVDGGSSDSTLEVLRRFPDLDWSSEPDRGFADAVNKGLKRARGEIIGIQSSDDAYVPGALYWAAAAFAAGPPTNLVAGHQVAYDTATLSPLQWQRTTGPLDLSTFLAMKTRLPQAATFASRKAVEDVGGLDADVDYLADYDLWARILAQGPGRCIPAYLAFYGLHPEQRNAKPENGIRFRRAFDAILAKLEGTMPDLPQRMGGPSRWESLRRLWDAQWSLQARDAKEAGRNLEAALKADFGAIDHPELRTLAQAAGLLPTTPGVATTPLRPHLDDQAPGWDVSPRWMVS